MNTESQAETTPTVEPMDSDQAVALVADKSPVLLFANGQADVIFDRVEAWARPIVFDINSEKGRSNLGGLIKKIGSVKNRIDEKAKAEIARIEEQLTPYKKERARIKKRFEALQAELKRPLTEAEDAAKLKAAKAQQIQQDINRIRGLGDPIQDGRELNVAELEKQKTIIESLEITADDFGDQLADAEEAKTIALKAVNNAIFAAEHLAKTREQESQQARSVSAESGPRSAADVAAEVFPDQAQAAQQKFGGDQTISDEDKKRMRQEALAAMMAFRFPQRASVSDEVYEALCKQLIGGVHLGKVPNMKMAY